MLTEKISELNMLEENGALLPEKQEIRLQRKMHLKVIENMEARKCKLGEKKKWLG